MAKKKARSKSTAVVKTAIGAMVPADQQAPDHIAPGSGRGSEAVTFEDIVVPRIDVVQALSPCRIKKDPAYINDAEEGMLFNSVTRELYGDSVAICPVLFKKEFLVWRDRTKGGGFAGAFDSEAEALDHAKEMDHPDDYDVLETAQHFCLVIKDASGHTEEAVVSMSRTKLKISRQLNSLVRLSGNSDRFARTYILSGVPDSNDKGDFFNFHIAVMGWSPPVIYERAQKLYGDMTAGQRIYDVDRSDDGEDASEGKEY